LLTYNVKIEDDGKLLKDVARKNLNLSTRLFNKLKLNHHIFINDRIAFSNDIVNKGDIITVDFNYDEEDEIEPQKGDIEILFEDDWYISVNKPSNMVVHPCSYHPNNTLANFVKYYLKRNKKIRPVNRLDKDTSGIVLFAKNEYAQESFNRMQDKASKKYLAIVDGWVNKKTGIINKPISRKENSLIERKVNEESGQTAITKYKVVDSITFKDKKCTLLEVELKTGRTHQIRVHMAYIGHPIIGDTLYNEKDSSNLLPRQALHAYILSFIHPVYNELITIQVPVPDDMKKIIGTITD
jgi:23S rRNA pseudouridine1911/1915/1917 synthase